jgi:phosphinothricin acetyltransferase
VTPTLRPAAPEADGACCAAIYAPYVRDTAISFELEPPAAEEMARRIALFGGSHGWLIAELEGIPVGYAYGSPHASRAAYATSCDVAVYVDRAFARQGIGRALYSALLPQLKDAGYHAAFAGIALPNQGSVALHEAMGFTQVGIYREVGRKFGAWHDVGWWQRLL